MSISSALLSLNTVLQVHNKTQIRANEENGNRVCMVIGHSRKTKLGRVEWNPGTLAGVLANERHCGDVLARKTFTPNFLTHLLVPEIFHEGQRKKNAVDSQDNAASTKPVNSRKGFYLDDIVGTFGVPVEEHRKESEVKQMDGYVSMGILTGKIAPEAGKD